MPRAGCTVCLCTCTPDHLIQTWRDRVAQSHDLVFKLHMQWYGYTGTRSLMSSVWCSPAGYICITTHRPRLNLLRSSSRCCGSTSCNVNGPSCWASWERTEIYLEVAMAGGVKQVQTRPGPYMVVSLLSNDKCGSCKACLRYETISPNALSLRSHQARRTQSPHDHANSSQHT